MPDASSTRSSQSLDFLMDRVEEALQQQKNTKRRLLFGYSLAVVGLLTAFFLMTWFTSDRLLPPEGQRQALEELETSASKLAVTFDSLSRTTTAGGDEAAPPDLAAQQAALMRESLEYTETLIHAARELVSSPLPTQLAIGQIIPLGGVVLVLGLLGLRRMQGYDRDIADARQELGATLQARLKEAREQTREMVQDAIARGFKEQSDSLKKLQLNIEKERESAKGDSREVEDRIREARSRIEDLISENPWLGESTAKSWLDLVNSISSVDQAHEASINFLAGERPNANAAREALLAIVDEERDEPLQGRATAFHNCFVQATRPPITDHVLAMKIAEAGLKQHPEAVALVADLVQVRDLLALDPPGEALQRLRETGAYWRDWRTVVFEASALARRGTEESLAQAIELLQEGVQKLNRDPRVWRLLADLHRQRGEEEEAERTLRQGLEACPVSQLLAYNLGELLLSWGRAEEGLEFLERAVECDYQEQFEPDVSQAAVLLTAGQAYEAAGRTDEAKQIYRRFLGQARRGTIVVDSRHMLTYAKARLALVGDGPEEVDGTDEAEITLTPTEALTLVTQKADELPLLGCIKLIMEHAGPPLPLGHWVEALEIVQNAHEELDAQTVQAIRTKIEERYSDPGLPTA